MSGPIRRVRSKSGLRVFDLDSDSDFEFEAVVTKLHVGVAERAEAFVGFRVREFVGNVREPGATRLEAIDEDESLLNGLVHWVRRIAESVHDKFIEVLQ